MTTKKGKRGNTKYEQYNEHKPWQLKKEMKR